jgi:hypothetical protein
LALRLTPYCRHTARTLTAIPEPCVRIHAHEAAHLRGDLQTLLDGALYVIHVHDRQLRRCRRYHADWCTIAAVYAAKLGEYATSRWLLRRALQSHRGRPSNYVRLALACVPPVARHIWRAES